MRRLMVLALALLAFTSGTTAQDTPAWMLNGSSSPYQNTSGTTIDAAGEGVSIIGFINTEGQETKTLSAARRGARINRSLQRRTGRRSSASV